MLARLSCLARRPLSSSHARAVRALSSWFSLSESKSFSSSWARISPVVAIRGAAGEFGLAWRLFLCSSRRRDLSMVSMSCLESRFLAWRLCCRSVSSGS